MNSDLTMGDVYTVLTNLNRKIDRIAKPPRFICRTNIIKEIGATNYNFGVITGRLEEIKGPAKNSRILIERIQYENFILSLKR